MKISEIAKELEYEYVGEDVDIKKISFDTDTDKNSLLILKDYLIPKTDVAAFLTKPILLNTDKTLLFTSDSLELSAVKVAKVLLKYGELKIYKKLNYRKTKDGYYVSKNVSIGKNTCISPNVFIGEDVIIGENCVIEENVSIKGGSVLGNSIHLSAGAVIGADSFAGYYDNGIHLFQGVGRVIIECGVSIGYHTVIQRGVFSNTEIGENSKIGNLVDIGHDVRIGKHCMIVSQSGIAGHAVLGDFVTVYGQSGIANYVIIEDRATVKACSFVTKNVRVGEVVSGYFARKHEDMMRIEAIIRKK